MTNEEIQKTMGFIIKQQESFSENMEQLRESHAKGEARLSRLEAAFVNL
jgi:septation ring formation regulator EzrA